MLVPKSLLSAPMKKWLQMSIASELYASNLYKHIANQLQRLGYFGGQKYFLKESKDELKHYQIIVEFMNDSLDVAEVPVIEACTEKITSIEDALQIAFETEVELFNQYKKFYEAAEEEDCSVGQFLLQFIEIQRTSVGEYGDLIARYNKCGKNEAAILNFDTYLSEQ